MYKYNIYICLSCFRFRFVFVQFSDLPTCKSEAACGFSKQKRRNSGREYEHRNLCDIWKLIAGGKLLCVLKTSVLLPKHFCFRMLVPMSMLTFWTSLKIMNYVSNSRLFCSTSLIMLPSQDFFVHNH